MAKKTDDTLNSLAAIVMVLVQKAGGKITLRREDLERAVLNVADGHGMTVRRDADGEEWVAVTLEYGE